MRDFYTVELPKSPEVVALVGRLSAVLAGAPLDVALQALCGLLMSGLFHYLPSEACAELSAAPMQEVVALVFGVDLKQCPIAVVQNESETVQ